MVLRRDCKGPSTPRRTVPGFTMEFRDSVGSTIFITKCREEGVVFLLSQVLSDSHL